MNPCTWFRVCLVAVIDVALSVVLCLRSGGSWNTLDEVTRRSTLDFVVISVLRAAVEFCCFAAMACKPMEMSSILGGCSTVFLSLTILMIIYSPLKLLIVSEDTEYLKTNYWFWALFCWNIAASALFLYILSYFQCSSPSPTQTTPNRVFKSDEISSLTEDQEKEKDTTVQRMVSMNPVQIPLAVKETSSLAWRLLHYCGTEWIWYLSGLVFLLLYSAGNL
ncbi:unnamed protein product [Soboliphyme baturini]|uniref:MARVEL domain-containing protein n=1 Tax=Soboliphyme baturini TaxID=241478 RepID=A0A183J9S2_9BILA|nr:unnamed protein product [Soboliphyme baturini]